MTTMNKTDSRLTALQEVEAGKIDYVPLKGTFREGPEEVSGARRRTFAELRTAGVIEGGEPMVLTESGQKLIKEWS